MKPEAPVAPTPSISPEPGKNDICQKRRHKRIRAEWATPRAKPIARAVKVTAAPTAASMATQKVAHKTKSKPPAANYTPTRAPPNEMELETRFARRRNKQRRPHRGRFSRRPSTTSGATPLTKSDAKTATPLGLEPPSTPTADLETHSKTPMSFPNVAQLASALVAEITGKGNEINTTMAPSLNLPAKVNGRIDGARMPASTPAFRAAQLPRVELNPRNGPHPH